MLACALSNSPHEGSHRVESLSGCGWLERCSPAAPARVGLPWRRSVAHRRSARLPRRRAARARRACRGPVGGGGRLAAGGPGGRARRLLHRRARCCRSTRRPGRSAACGRPGPTRCSSPRARRVADRRGLLERRGHGHDRRAADGPRHQPAAARPRSRRTTGWCCSRSAVTTSASYNVLDECMELSFTDPWGSPCRRTTPAAAPISSPPGHRRGAEDRRDPGGHRRARAAGADRRGRLPGPVPAVRRLLAGGADHQRRHRLPARH